LSRHLVLAAALLLSACHRGEEDLTRETQQWREKRDDMRRRLETITRDDTFVADAVARKGNLALAIRGGAAEDILREASRRYLDKVTLDLPLEKKVTAEGTVRVPTFFGKKMRAGEWTLEATVHRVTGVLAAQAPQVGAQGPDRIGIDIPVILRGGEGWATVKFRWDARSVANVVCRDFEVTKKLRGQALADGYHLRGAFSLRAGPESLLAVPELAAAPFRIHVDLSPASWAEVDQAIAEQDKLLKCGLALDPEEVHGKLRELLRRGFDIRLPKALVRSVSFPAGVSRSVTVAGQSRRVAVATSDWEVTPQALWYAAAVSVDRH
jgi:hypothetical protein